MIRSWFSNIYNKSKLLYCEITDKKVLKIKMMTHQEIEWSKSL